MANVEGGCCGKSLVFIPLIFHKDHDVRLVFVDDREMFLRPYFQSVCWLFPFVLSKSVWSSLVTFARSLCMISLCLAFSICRVDSRSLVPAALSVLLFLAQFSQG
jgi:hypothetical protein